jgi:simple sugar transport system substrate-binding protein
MAEREGETPITVDICGKEELVLVGKTSEKETAEFLNGLAYNEYGYALIGKRLVVTGWNDTTTELAVDEVIRHITEGADVIHIVPNSTETLEVAMKEAMDKGIIVITHEAPGAQNVHYDIEAFENKAYGEHLMEELAKLCDGKGGYAIIVGSVQAQTHMEWANAAVEYQKANYPEMHLVADFVESGEDHDTAYTKTQELLKTYSDLTGIIGCSVIDPAGAALAVEEVGKENEVSVIGTSVADVAGAYLETGAIDMYASWDTAQTSYAMCEVAKILAEGGSVSTGDNLGAVGYESVVVDGKVIYGNAWMDFTVDNYNTDPYIVQ